jgi:hypothetical protein
MWVRHCLIKLVSLFPCGQYRCGIACKLSTLTSRTSNLTFDGRRRFPDGAECRVALFTAFPQCANKILKAYICPEAMEYTWVLN